jgi:hypothetical protein
MTIFKTERIYPALENLITEWSSLNQDAKDAFVYEALKGFVTQGFYELPDDITVTGNKYFLEPYEVGLQKAGA